MSVGLELNDAYHLSRLERHFNWGIQEDDLLDSELFD